ncbi:MAG: hypothetical protein DBX55_10285 [Verrucomicrobia bacterium]|nr:MAG: hypothetical protein DBX55_10285 [Verrucomicrobiota bacterium]
MGIPCAFVSAFGNGIRFKAHANFAKAQFAFYKTCVRFVRGRVRCENSGGGVKKAFNAAEMD